jgi:hypothetical protein
MSLLSIVLAFFSFLFFMFGGILSLLRFLLFSLLFIFIFILFLFFFCNWQLLILDFDLFTILIFHFSFFLVFFFLLRLNIFIFLLSSFLILLFFDNFLDVFFTNFHPFKVIVDILDHLNWLIDLHFNLHSLSKVLNRGSTSSIKYEFNRVLIDPHFRISLLQNEDNLVIL